MEYSIQITCQRKLKVYEELRQGSDPRKAFFLLVAPRMTPILAPALGLLRGSPHLIGLAARSEALGVVVSIGMGFILGIFLPSYFEITPEMLSRTEPDLLVAVLAGIAGGLRPDR